MSHQVTRPKMRKFQILNIQDSHRAIIRDLAKGIKSVDIAEKHHVSRALVSMVKRSTLTRARIDAMHDILDMNSTNIQNNIRGFAPQALSLLSEVLQNDDAPLSTRVDVAQDLLDRGGFSAPKRTENFNITARLSIEQIDEIKKRAARAGYVGTVDRVDVEEDKQDQG